ncbi:MAG: transposase [Planctomycetia bacterium]|nr:transposase [Planctomycetia bacterium]
MASAGRLWASSRNQWRSSILRRSRRSRLHQLPALERDQRRGKQLRMRGPTCDGVLRLVTNRLDLPAELSAEIYRLRRVIEMFFRTFKQLFGCGHLFSNKHNGVESQAYCAMAESWMAERRRLRENEGPEGRSERPAMGHGKPRTTPDTDRPRLHLLCRTGLERIQSKCSVVLASQDG